MAQPTVHFCLIPGTVVWVTEVILRYSPRESNCVTLRHPYWVSVSPGSTPVLRSRR